MKVILREHVDNLGDRGSVVKVAAGYARNYLLPKKLALEATPGNLVQIEHQKRQWQAKETREVSDAEALAARISEVKFSLTKKAGESGTLYGSVTNVDVSALLADRGIEVDRKRIVMQPIKAVGTFEIPVKVHRKVKAAIQLEVVPEEVAE
ncbi:MAG: 50S ribosomal protein L9 [bacterium]|nr:50S ribosomal protein L9 [bacterium]